MGIADLVDGMAVEGISGNNCPAVASWLAAIGSADSGCIAVGCMQYIAVEGSACTACLAVADEGTSIYNNITIKCHLLSCRNNLDLFVSYSNSLS